MPLINCPDCNKEISDAAPTCPNCGYPLKQQSINKKEQSADTLNEKGRSVGLLLGIGITFIPYIFSWLTLRKGYSTTARTISFIWLAVVVIMINSNSNSPASPSNANPTNAAIGQFWVKGGYVDEFKNKTGETYITNNKRINGQFSNTATENSRLGVDLLINSNSIDIQLYEYNRDVPVKSSRTKTYYLFFLLDGKKYTHTGELSNDRIKFNGEAFFDIMNALKSNSEIKFNVIEGDRTTTSYYFEIPPNTNLTTVQK